MRFIGRVMMDGLMTRILLVCVLIVMSVSGLVLVKLRICRLMCVGVRSLRGCLGLIMRLMRLVSIMSGLLLGICCVSMCGRLCVSVGRMTCAMWNRRVALVCLVMILVVLLRRCSLWRIRVSLALSR